MLWKIRWKFTANANVLRLSLKRGLGGCDRLGGLGGFNGLGGFGGFDGLGGFSEFGRFVL